MAWAERNKAGKKNPAKCGVGHLVITRSLESSVSGRALIARTCIVTSAIVTSAVRLFSSLPGYIRFLKRGECHQAHGQDEKGTEKQHAFTFRQVLAGNVR